MSKFTFDVGNAPLIDNLALTLNLEDTIALAEELLKQYRLGKRAYKNQDFRILVNLVGSLVNIKPNEELDDDN